MSYNLPVLSEKNNNYVKYVFSLCGCQLKLELVIFKTNDRVSPKRCLAAGPVLLPVLAPVLALALAPAQAHD